MRVLILANSDVGLYKFRRELLEELLKEHEVYISIPKGDYVTAVTEMGCKVVLCHDLERRGMNPVQELKLISYYRKIVKDISPDIVFTYTIKPNVYGGIVCGMLKVPYVVNVTGLGTAVENPGKMQKIMLFLYKLGLKKAQKVFFQNTANRDFMLERKVVSGAYDLLPGSGVNLSQYQAFEYPKQDAIDFVFIARIMKEKGIDQYLEAAQTIRKKNPHTCFHVCGECEQDYEEKLKELQKQDVIVYHGVVHDIASFHKNCSCTIHPTYYPEGLSNVLLESCACARPIITTDRPGCREVVEDGVNGFICKQQDSHDLILQIEKFLALSAEERKQMGLAGRKKVEKEFNRQIVIDKYLKELEVIK